MSWHGSSDAPPLVRIAAMAPSLQRGERRVAEAIVADRSGTVERTAQELADAVGVGRTTVIRAVQSLGYEGYPQLRVALAQEIAQETAHDPADADDADGTMVGAMRAGAARFAARISGAVAALAETDVQELVRLLDTSHRVLVIANGLSSALGLDLVLRLNSVGRSAELLMDALSQQISARQLGEGSLCLVISGSGASRATLAGMDAARTGGARIAAITSFARSPVAEAADVSLVVPPVNESFQDELIHTSRAGILLVIEQLVERFAVHRGERGREAQAASLSVLGGGLQE
ncbi:MurR/RpiR family transcriptional regulator [Microbacterium sp. ARD32]|uniref:MurR/RpiR family transcriptional regulator n=1 Tax=Microbacterium sp. ARD32 TaxID=2962577 RepID=UPI00288122DD|nr:MurR/RpiR family transcriptional regulator [Microbacterium sp. ARD32]MDT0158697.1 MurR/RpiR family transcriptional regulator [Microbacterium sp. ARD32]